MLMMFFLNYSFLIIMVKMKWNTFGVLSLLTKLSSRFSYNNYLKTYQSHQITRHHGYFKVDEYNHFDTNPSQLKKFIKKERERYSKESQKWKSITEEYYKISSARRDSRTTTVPQIYDNYQYYTKVAWKNGREYSVIYRRSLIEDAKQEIVLDIMNYPQISRYYKTVQLLRTSFSPSHRYIAFGVDIRNNQKISFLIADTHHPKQELKKLKFGEEYEYRIHQTNDLIFAAQTQVYYTTNQNFRPNRLFYHNIETGQVSEILQENDPQYYLNIRVTKDRKFLIISANSKTKTKLWLLDLSDKKRQLIKVWEDSNKVYINHVQDYFILWIQGDKSQIKLIYDSSMKNKPKGKNASQIEVILKNLESIVLHSCLEEESVEQIDIIKDHIILYINHINKPVLKVIKYIENERKNQQKKTFQVNVNNAPLPYSFGVIMPGTNQNYNTNQIIYNVSTPFVYEEVYKYSVESNKFEVLQKYQHTGPSFPDHKYQIKHINVPSQTMDYIPLTIIGPKKRSVSKMIIHLYGFYGISSKITYDNVSIAALEKGWTIAYAHVRGGGEKGKKWHSEAQGTKRDRTWKDLEECIGYLIKQGYTHPSLLFISTSSAGAIATWSAINRKPHLYKGAIFRFPFLDVLNSLMDKNQPLSNADYEEFGNPIESKEVYKSISAISPYENINVKEYPAIHIVAGQNDYRTPLSQIAKFASRFRDRALENSRFKPLGEKGLTIDISETASHLGEASIKDENYKGCDTFGYMDYVINQISNDCSLKND